MRPLALSFAALLATIPPAHAQGGGAPSTPQREAARLDGEGKTAEARVIFQRLIDEAADPAAKAQAQRAMAMSYAFDGDCANAVKYEEMAIAYWATQEKAEPQNAFFQEGELANEAARVCIGGGAATRPGQPARSRRRRSCSTPTRRWRRSRRGSFPISPATSRSTPAISRRRRRSSPAQSRCRAMRTTLS